MRDYHYNQTPGNVGVQYESDPDAAYGDHIKNTCAICNSSASHVYGNVLSVVEKYLLDRFPKELFKTVTATTTLASKQIMHLPKQLHKKEMPIMVLIPRIVFGQDDRFLGNTLINSRVNNLEYTWGDGSLLQLAQDEKRNLSVNGHYNRSLMYVDIVLSFNTYSEQTNWMSYIHNMIPVGSPQPVRAPLELYIPDSLCKLIAGLNGIDVENHGSVYEFLTYMNTIFDNPITYKLKGGSNTNEFFMYYLTDLDVTLLDPQPGPGVKDGQIKRNFDITLTMRVEFNTIGYFMLTAPEITSDIQLMPSTDDKIVPIFSDSIDLNDFHLPIGWVILGYPIFKLEFGESSISIDSILNDSLRTVIDYHIRFNIPMERFIEIQFRENGMILDQEQYYIDWAARELHILKPDYHRTYRLIITASPDYINNVVKELYNLE